MSRTGWSDGVGGRAGDARRCAGRLAAMALAASLLSALGCARSLFGPAGTTRTQFDRFDQARNALPPAQLENEFGRFEPNLRGRLSRGD